MSYLISQTCAKYEENLKHNLEAANTRKLEILRYIKDTKIEITNTDGRKKGVVNCLKNRIEIAERNLLQMEERIRDMEYISEHVKDLADTDDQIANLVKRKRGILKTKLIILGYVRGKHHWFI